MIKFSKITTEYNNGEKLETVEASNGVLIQRLTTWDDNWGRKTNVQKDDWSVDGGQRYSTLSEAKDAVRN